MTVYQAIRQFSPLANDQSETDIDTETLIGKNLNLCYIIEKKFHLFFTFLGSASIWVQQQTIYYHPVDLIIYEK